MGVAAFVLCYATRASCLVNGRGFRVNGRCFCLSLHGAWSQEHNVWLIGVVSG